MLALVEPEAEAPAPVGAGEEVAPVEAGEEVAPVEAGEEGRYRREDQQEGE